MTGRLVVNADDFGLTSRVSSAIISAAQHGIVTSTTALMNTANCPADLRRAASLGRPAGLGVHLNLTFGRPLCDPVEVPSLVDRSGRFTPLAEKSQRPQALAPGEVQQEWTRQIKTFLSAGIELDHIDSHHFAAALSHPIWDVYLELAAEFHCGARPLPGSNSALAAIYPGGPPEALVADDWNEELRRRQIAAPDRVVTSFYSDGATRENLLSELSVLDNGWFELISHPGVDDDQLRSLSGYAHYRQKEYEILSDPELRHQVALMQLELVDYRGAIQA